MKDDAPAQGLPAATVLPPQVEPQHLLIISISEGTKDTDSPPHSPLTQRAVKRVFCLVDDTD
jgi:hypothetical protein